MILEVEQLKEEKEVSTSFSASTGAVSVYVYECPNPHNGAFSYVQSPLGLCEDDAWYDRAWDWWTDWSNPEHGYWNLQGNIPLGGLFGVSIAVIYDVGGVHLGVGAYLGTPGVSLTRGPNQQAIPNSHNVSGQIGFLGAGEIGQTFGPGSLENIYGEPSSYWEGGIGAGVSGNYLFITDTIIDVP
jgi:hypothetical protein